MERQGPRDTFLGVLVLAGLTFATVSLPGCPDRLRRVFSGSDNSEEVTAENPQPGVPTTAAGEAPDHTTPPLDQLDCSFVEVIALDFEEVELAATMSRSHATPQGALADCPGAEGAVGQPASVDGQMAGYSECFTIAPDWTPFVESPTGRFVMACYASE